jgi:hypothetical protein
MPLVLSEFLVVFNQNQSLFMVGLTWDPFYSSPLTIIKIMCVVGLT